MAVTQNAINSHVFKGRKQILTNIGIIDKTTIPSIINSALDIHESNKEEIEALENYYLGDQQIQYRIKEQRPDINNKITVNNAYAITRIINGVAYGNQIQIIPRNKEVADQVKTFNNFSLNEMKHKKDMEISNWQSICGTAYVLVLPNLVDKYNVPFKTYVLNPKTTFCVYSNTIDRKRVLGVTYIENIDEKNNVISVTYTIYSDRATYTYTTTNKDFSITASDFIANALEVPRMYSNKVPIVEYQNDMFAQGDWEMTISLLDGINLLTSDRLNQFVQNVSYLYKMINLEFEEGIKSVWEVIDKGFIQLTSGAESNNKADFDILTAPIDQSNVQELANYLQDKLELVVGIPNRQTRGGGGDTGTAVFLRNGLDDTHTRIAIKHAFRIASEMEVVDLKLDITNKLGLTTLNNYDIDINITPVRHDNSQQTAQALQIYDTIGFPKDDALSLLNLTQDPTSLSMKWEETQEEKKEKEIRIEQMKKQPVSEQTSVNMENEMMSDDMSDDTNDGISAE